MPMRRANFAPVSIASFLLLLLVVPPCAVAAARDANADLEAFFTAEWDYLMRENPLYADTLGDLRFNEQLGEFSLAATQRRHRHESKALARLRAIFHDVPGSGAVPLDVLERNVKPWVEAARQAIWPLPRDQE